MQYQVLARKWRPQNFHDIVGQEHISRTLLNALDSARVAHAFLFSGPRGTGKTTTARILAKALNCHADRPGEPCGKCAACVEIAAGNCMDVLEIDAASNTGVDNVRNLIEEVHYRPARDRNKIYIIDEVHMLSNAAFNALLKTLEEPPPHVFFIMATTEYQKIPATILSRCQQYSFKLIKFPLVLERLRLIAREEKIQISSGALEQVVFSSGGSMRDAMSALDQVIAFSGETVRDEDVTMLLGLVEPALLAATVRAIAANDIDKILTIVGDLVEAGQDLSNFCRRLLGQLRNLVVLKAGVSDPALLGVPDSLLPDLREQAALFSREDLLRLFDALLKIDADVKHAAQVRFELEMGLIELSHMARMRSLEDLIADFTNLVREEAPATGAVKPAPLETAARRPEPPATRVPGTPQSPGDSMPQEHTPPAAAEKAAKPPHVEHREPGLQPAAGPSRELLLRIAGRVQKESLESILQSLAGAEVRQNSLILHLGASNEFFRRQVKENLPLIAQAVSEVLGRALKVQLGDEPCPGPAASSQPSPPPANPRPDPLDRAKREPVVRSFLDVFPGPVKAEDIDT